MRTGWLAVAVLAGCARTGAREPEVLAAPMPPSGAAAGGLLIRRSDCMQRPPDADLGPARMWVVERGDAVQCMLIEIDGVLPLHLHPDGVHRMYVLDGRIRVSIGEHTQDLGPGDYIRIPRGAKHRIERVGIGTAHYASVDTPPVEAARIVWIEAAPRR